MASTQTTSTVPVMFHDRCVVATDLHCDGGARRLVWLKSLLLRCQQLSSPLLILGDLFDLWWGPGQIKASDTRLELEALKMAVRSGTAISLLPGNRDFLLDQSFQDETGVEVLGDAVDMRIGGLRWHFSHGGSFWNRRSRLSKTPEISPASRESSFVVISSEWRFQEIGGWNTKRISAVYRS